MPDINDMPGPAPDNPPVVAPANVQELGRDLIAAVLRRRGNQPGSDPRERPGFEEPNLKALSHYSSLVHRGDLCFDVGAHDGSRTAAFRRLGARVLAIEPQSLCVDLLTRRFADDHEVTIITSALGEREGMALLHLAAFPSMSSLRPDWLDVASNGHVKHQGAEEVHVTTLDRLIEGYGVPDFLKIDVEGGELAVLRGLSKKIRACSFEFWPVEIEAALACVDLLETFGRLELNFVIGETLQFQLPEWISSKAMKDTLRTYARDNVRYGDLYVRYQQRQGDG